MTLYYEDVPAADNDAPQLPPLLNAVAVPADQDLQAKAIALAAQADVGTVFYSEATDKMHIAVVLGPEVPLAQAGQMLFAMMIAVGDAVGALAPPEVAVSYQIPGFVLLNRGRAGVVRMMASPAASTAVAPDWLVVSAELVIADSGITNDEAASVPRTTGGVEHTSLAEEGGGFISRTRIVESCSRHFLVWVNRWQDDGFRPLYDAWMHRLDAAVPLVAEAGLEWLGLDEDGAVLVKLDGKPMAIPPHELETFCGVPALDRPQR